MSTPLLPMDSGEAFEFIDRPEILSGVSPFSVHSDGPANGSMETGAAEEPVQGTTEPVSDIETEKYLYAAIVLDATASMEPYIENSKKAIKMMAEELQKTCDDRTVLMVALIVYRDFGDGDGLCEIRDFSSDMQAFERMLDDTRSYGGNDFPEAVGTALHAANGLSWKNTTRASKNVRMADDTEKGIVRVVNPTTSMLQDEEPLAMGGEQTPVEVSKMLVLVTDAPPHGLSGVGYGDRYSDPHDALTEARLLGDKGVRLDVALCPVNADLKSIASRDAVYRAMAASTQGRTAYLPANKPEALIPLVVGSALECKEIDDAARDMESEVVRLAASFKDLARCRAIPFLRWRGR